MTTTEQQQQKKVPNIEAVHDGQLKQAMMAVTSACIWRLGSESPAFEFAQNRFLLEDLKDMLVAEIDHLLVFHDGTMYTYTISTNSWSRGMNVSQLCWYHAVTHVRDRDYEVFYTDGYTGGPTSKSVYSLTVPTVMDEFCAMKLKTMPDMRVGRLDPGFGVAGGNVYVIGGHDPREIFKTVEVLSVKDGKWIDGDPRVTPDMLTARYLMGVAVIGKKIYAIGGRDGDVVLRTVEVLDTETNKWLSLPQMKTARSGVGITVVDDRYIWIFGGWDGRKALDSIEIFDAAKNEWFTPQIKLTRAMYKIGTVAVGHKIYVLQPGAIEVLDVDKLEWTILVCPEPCCGWVDYVIGY